MGVVEQFKRWHRAVEASTGVELELFPPATLEELSDAEERLGLALPGQVRELYLHTSGGARPFWLVYSLLELREHDRKGRRDMVSWTCDTREEFYEDGSLYGPKVARQPYVVVVADESLKGLVEPDGVDGSPGRVLAVDVGSDWCQVYASSLERVYEILTDCAEADLFIFIDDWGTSNQEVISWWFMSGDDPVKLARLEEIRLRYPGEGHYLLPRFG